jgi:hypothetical protein
MQHTELNGERNSQNVVLFQFRHECNFGTLIPKYLSFITFSKDLLATLI